MKSEEAMTGRAGTPGRAGFPARSSARLVGQKKFYGARDPHVAADLPNLSRATPSTEREFPEEPRALNPGTGRENIEHPTSNAQHPMNRPAGDHWTFDVGC